jgi:hypothetical protein
MSNHLISEVYRRQVGNMARNAVMVLLADKASDDGSGIWASKQRMADEIRETGERRCLNGFTVEYAIDVAALHALPLVKSHSDNPSKDLTRQSPIRVKELDGTRQSPLRDPSKDLTQTLLNPPEPNKRAPAERAKALVRPDEVSEQVWADFLKLRKAQRAPVSATAIAGITREAKKAGWSLEQAMTECVARGWRGFKADWVQSQRGNSSRPADSNDFLQHMIAKSGAGADPRSTGQLALSGPQGGQHGGEPE